VKTSFFGRRQVVTHGGRRTSGLDPVAHAREMARRGAGEILLNSVDRDGTLRGYDLELVGEVAHAVSVPVIACGGAGRLAHMAAALRAGASAAAAGSLFCFSGPHRAVLITYPDRAEIDSLLESVVT
jgi:cyclase